MLAQNEAVSAAKEALTRFEHQIYREKMAAEKAVNEKHAAELSRLRRALRDAERARDEHIEATTSHPWNGKKVISERTQYQSFRHKKVLLRGIVEIVSRESRFPENFSSWRRPGVGSIIVRQIKRDGTPSLRFHNAYRHAEKLERDWSLETEGAANVGTE